MVDLYLQPVSAGFPLPAEDYIEQELDLNKYCIPRPAATFFVRVQGDSMKNAGIFSDDILVVDRSLNALHNDIIVAIYQNEFLVKRLIFDNKQPILRAENPDYSDLYIQAEDDFQVWGVVAHIIRSLKTK